MDRYQRLIDKVANLEALLAELKVELREYAEDTDRDQAETEAHRRRRDMRFPTLIPVVAVTQSPVASAGVALIVSAIIGAIVVHPGGGVPRDTAPGVIAGQQPPAAAMEPRPPRSLTRPKEPAPVSIRPVRKKPAPQQAPKAQTVGLTPVRATTPPVTRNTVPMRATTDRPPCVARVGVLDFHVRLRCR